MKSAAKKTVRAQMDQHGIIVFRLLQGGKKLRTMHTFGYGTHHKVWLRLEGIGTNMVMMSAEPEAKVKEQIARWGR